MLQVESLQPPGHDTGNFSITYKSNDPQIFHLQKKLWLYKLFMRLGACFGTMCTLIALCALQGALIGLIFTLKTHAVLADRNCESVATAPTNKRADRTTTKEAVPIRLESLDTTFKLISNKTSGINEDGDGL